MASRNVPLDPGTATRWAKQGQLLLLDSLMAQSEWQTQDMVFHGGTSLHLAWASPRFSEDLDFLISRNVENIQSVMTKVIKRMQEQLVSFDPHMEVTLKDKTRDAERMPYFQIHLSKPGVLGHVMIKAEFWRVAPDYLKNYPTQLRQPRTGDISATIVHPIPAANLETAFCDKLTAFATRPYLKWRDIFDLWWIGTQTDTSLDMKKVAPQFLHNLSAYRTPEDMPAAQALRRFCDRSIEDVVKAADPDLKKWLPETLWRHLHPEGTRDMVLYARSTLEAIATFLETDHAITSPSTLKRLKTTR